MGSSHISSLPQDNQTNLTGSNPGSLTSVSVQPETEVPIWFSVFIGDPDPISPRFDHARFDAKISNNMFAFQRTNVIACNDLSGNISNASSDRERQGFREEISVFCAVVSLSLAFTEEMLGRLERGCIVCNSCPAESLIHRPLCATENGYHELADFQRMYKLMSTIASHTDCITQTDEVNWSIGSVMCDRPYVCSLAMPICSTNGQCHRIATERAQQYIEGIIDGVISPQPVDSAYSDPDITNEKSETPASSTHSTEQVISNYSFTPETDLSDLPAPDSPLEDDVYNIGTTMFVGRPSLQVTSPSPEGELSCLVLSTTFPKSAMPDNSKNEADAAIDYCRVSGYYEQDILHHLSLRCAVCSKPVVASTLVHLPIAFPRTHKACLEDGPVRKLIMKLCRFVNGTWNYPEMNAALGFDSDAHIFELVVPICRTKSICEEVARISAREFIRLLTPSGVSLPFPGLNPDTNLAAVHAIFRSFSKEEPEPAEGLVEKIASECIISGSEEQRKDDPKDRVLSVSKLRLWFEMCYKDQEVKRESLGELEPEEDQAQSQLETEESEAHDSVVWVFDLVDHSCPLDEDEEGLEAENPDPLIQEYRNQEMFQPLLTWDFWLLCETIGEGYTADDSCFSDDVEEIEDEEDEYSPYPSSDEEEGYGSESEGSDSTTDPQE